MKLIYALFVVSLLGLTACENEGPAERVGEDIDNAAENVQENTEEAAEEIEDEVDDATN